MSAKLSAPEAETAALIQQVRNAPGIHTFWLPLSYMMAVVDIESGFDATRWTTPEWGSIPASDYGSTGSEGLMQVASATAADIVAAFPQAGLANKPQTDPLTSLTTGMLYFDLLTQYLAPKFGAQPAWKYLIMAYNEGPGEVWLGRLDNAYYFKWLATQAGYAVLDVG